jgi:hypothetical protein
LLFLKTRLPLHRFREKDELVKANFEKDCGEVAQSVEQRTENPCVGGSIPSFTTHFSLSKCLIYSGTSFFETS